MSTAAQLAAGFSPWLNIESARWLRIQSAPTHDDGRGRDRGGHTDAKLTVARYRAAQAWLEIAKALSTSDDIADRELSRSVVNYARWLPGVRVKQPERQPQRELPGLERTAVQRTRPDPGWER